MLRRGAILLAALAAMLVPAQAQAAFPGANGRIFFVSHRDGNPEIYSMNPDGSGVARLTNNPATDDQPAVSPDGKQVAFVSNRIGDEFAADIWIMNADGTGQRRVTTATRPENDPAFLPNGRIMYRSGKDGDYEIYSSNTNGGAEVQITNNTVHDYFPAASPNGLKIALNRDVGADIEVYAMNANGTGATRLTFHEGLDARPNWAPDNSKVAYFSDLGDSEIVTYSAGGAVTNVTKHPAGDTTPAFSPNGARLAFTSTRDIGNAEIYVMNADGSGQTRVTVEDSADYDPDWGRVPVSCATPGGITDANDANPGNGVVQGTGGWDLLKGGAGHETLDGKAGNDVLCGGAGSDTLLGGPGPAAGADADTLVGETGSDLADYSARTAAIILDLNPATDLFAVEGQADEGDSVHSSVESGRTGSGADVLRGNTAANALFGGDGADNINPGAGRDYVDAGAGDDSAINVADNEADTVVCGTGFDPFSPTEFDPIDSLAADCEQG